MTEIPRGALYYLKGASTDREHRMNELVKDVEEMNALNAEAQRLVDIGDDMAISLQANLEKALAVHKLALAELHDLARMSLSEKKCKGHYPTESGLTFGDSLQPTFCDGECVRPNPSADADAENTNKCKGHYDDDVTLVSGESIGSPTFCDGSCS